MDGLPRSKLALAWRMEGPYENIFLRNAYSLLYVLLQFIKTRSGQKLLSLKATWHGRFTKVSA